MRSLLVAGLALALLAQTGAVPEARAEGLNLSTKNARAGLAGKLAVLDSRASRQYAGSTRLQPREEADQPAARAIPRYQGSYSGPYLQLAREAARKHGIPEELFLRLVHRESAFNAGAVSHKGAIGLAQLMPGTAQVLRVDPLDPGQNLEGGARYLKIQFERFGSWQLALAAYNAGPEAVTRHSGVPPYSETVAYVAAILGG